MTPLPSADDSAPLKPASETETETEASVSSLPLKVGPDLPHTSTIDSVLAELDAAMERLAGVEKATIARSAATDASEPGEDLETFAREAPARPDTLAELGPSQWPLRGDRDATTTSRLFGGPLPLNLPRDRSPFSSMGAPKEETAKVVAPPVIPKVAAPTVLPKVAAPSATSWLAGRATTGRFAPAETTDLLWSEKSLPPPAETFDVPDGEQSDPQRARSLMSWLGIAVGVGILIGLGAFLLIRPWTTTLPAAGTRDGRLMVESQPPGAEVMIDGKARGATPLTMSLEVGTHTMVLHQGAQERTVPLQVAAGADIQQYFDFRTAPPAPPVTPGSRISVVTDPAGAQVSIDGRPRGVSPLTVADLSPGEHRVAVTGATGSATRTLNLDRGGAASVVFSLQKLSTPLAGWLTVSAPFESQILENNELLGTTTTSKIMLPAGRHEITLMNQALGYQESRRTDVVAGKVTILRLEPPRVTMSANARPWADVFVDGKAVGQTPIANVELPIGPHEVVFRHPQLGDRRQTVVLTVKGPNRISVDLTK